MIVCIVELSGSSGVEWAISSVNLCPDFKNKRVQYPLSHSRDFLIISTRMESKSKKDPRRRRTAVSVGEVNVPLLNF